MRLLPVLHVCTVTLNTDLLFIVVVVAIDRLSALWK